MIKKNTIRNLLPLVVGCLGIAALISIDRWQQDQWHAGKAEELRITAELYRNRLEGAISSRFNAVESLAALFALNPETTSDEFGYFSSLLAKSNPPIRALQYADAKTRVTYVYPPKGNEITITSPMTLLADPKRGPYVKKAIEQRRASLQGPFALRQGGVGVVVRSPIFKSGTFVGLAIGVFNVDRMIDEAFMGVDRRNFDFSLADSSGAVFLGEDGGPGYYRKQFVDVLDTQWTLSFFRTKDSLPPPAFSRALIWALGICFIISALMLLRLSLAQTTRLEKRAEERTKELLEANKKLTGEMAERRRSEAVLQQSEARFRKMIEKSPLPMVITDQNQDIVFFNDKFIAAFGYTLDDVSTGKQWWETTYPDEAYRGKVQQSWMAAIEKAEAAQTDIEMQQWDLTIKDGTKRSCEFYMVPLGDVSLIIMNDITEKRRAAQELWVSKERFRKVFNSQLDAIFVLNADPAPAVIECNSAATEIFGYETGEIVGDTVRMLHVSESNMKAFRSMLYPEIEKHGFMKDVQFSMKRKDGTIFPTEHTVLAMHDDAGRRTGWISIVRDLTERRRLETRLQQAQKMEAIGTLAGGIAHDFNNILFPLLGFAEMLQEDLPKDGPLQDNIAEVLQAALRAKDLVQQILTFSRQGAQALKPVRLQSILKEAVKLLGASIPKTIDIQTDIDPDCGVVVADSTQIHQIVMNLATNAYHAMQASGGRLDITLKQVDVNGNPPAGSGLPPGKYALLKVADTGAGIAQEVMEKIFDPYFTTKETGRGTGLGLSVVQGIVENYKGDILVDSKPGKGTAVRVYLPVMKRAVESLAEEAAGPIMGGAESVLLVDDEEAIVKMEGRMLQRLGYRVMSRTGSIEALAAFRADPDKFDLVVTDMTMPHMTGVQLAEKIKAIRGHIPIIVCTGFSDQITREKSKEMGIDGYLMKPLTKREMARTVREVLDRSGEKRI